VRPRNRLWFAIRTWDNTRPSETPDATFADRRHAGKILQADQLCFSRFDVATSRALRGPISPVAASAQLVSHVLILSLMLTAHERASTMNPAGMTQVIQAVLSVPAAIGAGERSSRAMAMPSADEYYVHDESSWRSQ